MSPEQLNINSWPLTNMLHENHTHLQQICSLFSVTTTFVSVFNSNGISAEVDMAHQ